MSIDAHVYRPTIASTDRPEVPSRSACALVVLFGGGLPAAVFMWLSFGSLARATPRRHAAFWSVVWMGVTVLHAYALIGAVDDHVLAEHGIRALSTLDAMTTRGFRIMNRFMNMALGLIAIYPFSRLWRAQEFHDAPTLGPWKWGILLLLMSNLVQMAFWLLLMRTLF